MPFRSVAVILNPVAGNRRAGRARAQLREALEASGVPFEIIATERPNHAATLARRAATQFDAVIAGGGDGTVQEVATGLLGHATPFGVLPLGTGNDFARQLGVPKRPAEAVRALLAADVVPVDAGTVRWRNEGDAHHIHEAVFVNAVGIGFDALVAAEAAQFKVFRGISGYVAAVAKALRMWKQPDVEVRRLREPVVAGEGSPPASPPMYEGPFFLAAVSNGTSVGGGFRLTPDALIDDGLLDLCLVSGPLSLARIARLLPKAIAGRHLGEPEVRMDRVDALALRLSAGVPIHVDGEVLTRSAVEVDVEVQPAAFRMLRVGPPL